MSSPSVSTHRSARRLFTTFAAAFLVCPAAAQAYPVHTVVPGETLTSIAAANGMVVARLAAANGMAWNGQVVVGQALQVPPRDGLYTSTTGQTMGTATSSAAARRTSTGTTGTPAATPAAQRTTTTSSTGSSSGSGTYVRPGDTLSAIAARLRVSLSALAAANGISSYDLIYSGTTLRAPAPGTTATPAPSAVPTTSSTGPEGAAAAQGVGAHPTTLRLTSAQVAQVAAQNGVPGNLAAAIAWQESGNNNAMVSSAGARGIMQVMPGTWDWINSTLARPPLNRASAVDNVRAGSLLLKQLLAQTGGDANTAIAGYYQGLGSVRSRGLYDDTKQYVANVNAIRARLGG